MIAIEGMDKLPENCHSCPFSYWITSDYEGNPKYNSEPDENWCPWNNCITDQTHGGDKKRMRGCPLKEVQCE